MSIGAALDRLSYRLTFARSNKNRIARPGELIGDPIDNADPYGYRDNAPGSWDCPDGPEADRPTDEHIAAFFTMAVGEAVHEALEWFRLDDEVMLDPHGEHELKIHSLSEQMAKQLLDLAGRPNEWLPPWLDKEAARRWEAEHGEEVGA